MADRSIIYDGEVTRTFDILSGWKDPLKALGFVFGDLAAGGIPPTVVAGFVATQSATPNMTINIAQGSIYTVTQLDATAYSSLPIDTLQLVKQGYAAAQTLTLTVSALGAGQSQWVLIEATYQDIDAVRAGDPSGGILPYFNATVPSQPLQGPNNSGTIQNTVRQGVATFKVAYGPSATTGQEVPPGVDAGYVPLYLIDLNNAQTQILNSQILVAGPSAYGGYTQAPFIKGLLNQHHLGITGSAPKIQLGNAAEVQGILPLANLFASNIVGILPTIRSGIVDPQGVVAGNAFDFYLNTVKNVIWFCVLTGSSTSAQWVSIVTQVTIPPQPNSNLVGPLLSNVSAGVGIAVTTAPSTGVGSQTVATANIPDSVLSGPLVGSIIAGTGIAVTSSPSSGQTTNVNNVTVSIVPGQSGFAQSFTDPGYIKFPDGIIIQWGSVVLNGSEGLYGPFTFATTFPNKCFNLSLTTVTGEGGPGSPAPSRGSDTFANIPAYNLPSTSQFYIFANWVGAGDNYIYGAHYVAIGY